MSGLDPDEVALVGRCLIAAVDGPFFPDWEFQILMGVTRAEAREVAQAWPAQTVPDDAFWCAVLNPINNLLGYPHGHRDELTSRIEASPKQLLTLMQRLLEMEATTRAKPQEPD